MTVIFDMDGVIVDSAACHYQTWCALLSKRGIDYSYEDFKHNFGRRTDMQVRRILGDIPDKEVAAISEEKNILFREFAASKVRALPGVADLITSIKKNGGKVGIGSSRPWRP